MLGRLRSLGKSDDPRRTLAVRLGAIFYVAGGLAVLITEWALPASVNYTVLTGASIIAITAGLGVCALPWERWPRRSLLVLPVAGNFLVGGVGLLAPNALPHYVDLYALTLVYVGLTQPPGSATAIMPLSVLSFVVGTRGPVNGGAVVNAVIAGAIGLFVSEALAHVVTRFGRAEDNLRDLLTATQTLSLAADVQDAADILCEAGRQLLRGDVAVVYTSVADQPGRYVSRSSRGGRLPSSRVTVDIDRERSGLGEALRQGRMSLVSDTREPGVVSERIVRSLGMASVLYAPLPAQIGHVGGLVVGWNKPVRRLDDIARTTTEVLSTEAGAVLERLGATARLVHEAETDPLTGLLNRRSFNRCLDATRAGDTVVLIDLDHFKQINDQRGHGAGDEVLRSMADCLRQASRSADHLGRWGGEACALIRPRTGLGGAHAVIERLRADWAATQPLTTFSAGIAERLGDEGPVLTLGRADAALYDAKRAGRDRVQLA